jgi:hypothetical protein
MDQGGIARGGVISLVLCGINRVVFAIPNASVQVRAHPISLMFLDASEPFGVPPVDLNEIFEDTSEDSMGGELTSEIVSMVD